MSTRRQVNREGRGGAKEASGPGWPGEDWGFRGLVPAGISAV